MAETIKVKDSLVIKNKMMKWQLNYVGQLLKSAAFSYIRKTANADLTAGEHTEQSKTHIIFTENNFTNVISDVADYHLRLFCGVKHLSERVCLRLPVSIF